MELLVSFFLLLKLAQLQPLAHAHRDKLAGSGNQLSLRKRQLRLCFGFKFESFIVQLVNGLPVVFYNAAALIVRLARFG